MLTTLIHGALLSRQDLFVAVGMGVAATATWLCEAANRAADVRRMPHGPEREAALAATHEQMWEALRPLVEHQTTLARAAGVLGGGEEGTADADTNPATFSNILRREGVKLSEK